MILQIDFAQFAPRLVLEQAQQDLTGISTNEAQIEGELNQTGVGALSVTNEQAASTMLGAAMRQSHTQASNPASHSSEKIGRNDACPCGSGKKYKKCHGKDV